MPQEVKEGRNYNSNKACPGKASSFAKRGPLLLPLPVTPCVLLLKRPDALC